MQRIRCFLSCYGVGRIWKSGSSASASGVQLAEEQDRNRQTGICCESSRSCKLSVGCTVRRAKERFKLFSISN
jgi:hypothetical protein